MIYDIAYSSTAVRYMDKLYEGNSAIILTAVVDPKSTNIEIRNLKVEFDEYVHEGHCKREIKEA